MIQIWHELSFSTRRQVDFYEITAALREDLRRSKIQNGVGFLLVPHTTAGLTINENADPDVVRNMIYALNRAFPVEGEYLHIEGNSHAHIKASLMGSSCTVIIRDKRLMLGTWQGIYFCEFDGPRDREFFVKIIEG